jgi:hypothetical protein
MNKIILSIILALGIAPGAKADLTPYQNLLNTVNEAGVSVHINPEECFEKLTSFDGYYHSIARKLVICQDGAKKAGDRVRWTANDLDTIRHEVHHMVQDCMDGTLADGRLTIFFDDKDTLVNFIENSIGEDKANQIVESYEGASNHTHVLELEAFSVAESVSPESIQGAVAKFCF